MTVLLLVIPFAAGARIRSSGTVRLFSAIEILPVFTVRADVYGPGGRSDGHPGLQIDVPRSPSTLRAGPAAV